MKSPQCAILQQLKNLRVAKIKYEDGGNALSIVLSSPQIMIKWDQVIEIRELISNHTYLLM